LLGLVSAACAIAPALGDDWGSLRGTLSVTSDYRYRGVSGNDRKPALQGEAAWSHPDGWHAGVWTSMIDFNDHQNTPIEVDLSAGKQVNLRGTIVDFTIAYYSYPIRSRPSGAPPYSFVEASAKVSHSWGDFTLNGEIAWSPNSFGETGQSWYVRAGAAYQVRDWLSASANIGRQWVKDLDAIAGSGFPYTHWDVGLTAAYDKFSLDVRYVDNDLSKDECLVGVGARDWCAASAIATLSYTMGE
jgi:uncharacterized protein (TIGR02001 family)